METLDKGLNILHADVLARCSVQARPASLDECLSALPQGGNRGAVVLAGENSRAGHENVGAGLNDSLGIIHFHAAVHFQIGMAAGIVEQTAGALDFTKGGGNKMLTAKSWAHRHDEQEIDVG